MVGKKERSGARLLWLGNMELGPMMKMRWPFCGKSTPRPPPFYGPNEPLGILPAAIMGLQHSLAMIGGLITPPLLVGMMAPDPWTKAYLIQAALLVCGFMTFVQVTGFRVPRTQYQWGSGVLSVMGVSFASVPLMTSVVGKLMAEGLSFDEAFGKMLGTAAICAVWPLVLSFLPFKALRRLFPPIVTGVVIFLIGANLVATGFKYWGGGVFCADNYKHLPKPTQSCQIPQPDGSFVTAPCFNAAVAPMCTNNGDVKLPYGSGPYVGMGLLVFSLIILIELFGSPFMRNAAIVLALLVGLLVSAAVTVDGKRFLTPDILRSSPWVTFLWLKRFPLGFYAPAVLPLLIVFSITSVETVGDVTATAEISLLDVDGPEHVRRIRGGMLNDGVSGIFSALAGSLPLTTFAQNNGVISLTGVASRWAGWAAAAWLLLAGVIGKFGGLILSIPHCVLGGATSFLFAAVLTSGIKIIMMGDGLSRRNRFIVSCSIAFGLGVTMVPQWSHNNLWPEGEGDSAAAQSARLAVMLVLETGFCVGGLVAFFLNMVLPREQDAVNSILLPSVHQPAAKLPPTALDAGNPSSTSLYSTDATVVADAPQAPVMDKDIDLEGAAGSSRRR